MRFLVSISRLLARRCSILTHAEGPGSDVEIAMIDSLAFQPALGWYRVPFWLDDGCSRGRLRPRKYHGTKQFVFLFLPVEGALPSSLVFLARRAGRG